MNEQQRLLVKTDIETIGTDINALSQLFYRELFHIDIGLKRVFPGNVVFLNRKFANMIATFKNVGHLDKISASIGKMGERHLTQYGVQTEHFKPVSEALLLALSDYFGDAFNQERKAAWQAVFDAISAIMAHSMDTADRRESKRPQYDEAGYDTDLLAEVGGEAGVLRVHERFYEVIFNDPWLGQFFYGKHQDVLAEKQSKFMVAAFGGDNHYTGDTPAFVHMHMFITDEMSGIRQQMLRQAILDEGHSESIAERWLKVDDSFRQSIVKKSVDECVLKCRGQIPVAPSKPIGYRSPFKPTLTTERKTETPT